MATSKHGHESHYGEPGATHAPIVNDPEHDIDARSATIWFVAGAIVLFVSLWVMVPIFIRVQGEERIRKVDSVPNEEYGHVKEAQQQFLQGANPTKQTIDQVLQKMVAK